MSRWIQLTPRPPRPPKVKRLSPPPEVHKQLWRLDPNSDAAEALRQLRSKLVAAGDGADSERLGSVAGTED